MTGQLEIKLAPRALKFDKYMQGDPQGKSDMLGLMQQLRSDLGIVRTTLANADRDIFP